MAAAPLWAADAKQTSQPAQSTAQQPEQLEQAVGERANAEQEKVLKEAIAAVRKTGDAVRALDKGDKERALDNLVT